LISGQGLGLLAVAAGAIIAISLQQVIRHFRDSTGRTRQLKEECAQIITLSADLHNRAASGQVNGWDAPAYREAKTRLRSLKPPNSIQSALNDLDETQVDLTLASRLAEGQENIAEAMQAHADAIDHFAASSAILVRISWVPVSLFQVSVASVKLISGLPALFPESVEHRVEQDERQLLEERPGVLA
jgi:hypothetical protein